MLEFCLDLIKIRLETSWGTPLPDIFCQDRGDSLTNPDTFTIFPFHTETEEYLHRMSDPYEG